MFIILFLLTQLVRQMEIQPEGLTICGLSSDYRTVIYFYELRVEIYKLKEKRFIYLYYKGNCVPYEEGDIKQKLERICQLLWIRTRNILGLWNYPIKMLIESNK